MNGEQPADLHARAKKLFLAVCDLSEDDQREYLDEACGRDGGLRAEIEALLAHHVAGDETAEFNVAPLAATTHCSTLSP